MDTTLLKNLTCIDLVGANVYHNQDHTHAKAFVELPDGKFKPYGVSTMEREKPDALERVLTWPENQGIATTNESEADHVE